MPNTYTPTGAALTTVTEPIDGEPRSAASVTTMTRKLADGIAAMQAIVRVVPGDALRWMLAAAQTLPSTPESLPFHNATVAELVYIYNGARFETVDIGGTPQIHYGMSLDPFLTDANTLTAVKVHLDPAAGGVLPVLPAIRLVRTDRVGAAATLLSTGSGWATDPSATNAAYRAAHDITFTPNQNNVINKALYMYSMYFANEGGPNAVAAGILYSVELTSTRPT